MKQPNHNEAGMLGFALASALMERLVANGVLTDADQQAILLSARESIKRIGTANAGLAVAWIDQSSGLRP